MLLETSVDVKDYDGKTKWMYFLIKNVDLLNKYHAIWDKTSVDAKIELHSKPVCNKIF